MSYEILLEGRETIEGWSVCTVCLNVDRTAAVTVKKWRCSDCGIDASNDSQQVLRIYLLDNPPATLETNLRQWAATKRIRPAYKMLRSARYKCLLNLSRKQNGQQQ